jgi:hypothetical protein
MLAPALRHWEDHAMKARKVKIKVKNGKITYSRKKKPVHSGDTLSFSCNRDFALQFLMNQTPLDSGKKYLSGAAGTATTPELIKYIPKAQKPMTYEYAVAVNDNGTLLLDDPIIIIEDGGGGGVRRQATTPSRKKAPRK